MSNHITHVGFSDESHWNDGRFRSLGLVTAPLEHVGNLTDELRSLLMESSVVEFKWRELKGAKERFAADKMCRHAVAAVCQQRLRIDVLIWDIRDSRHDIARRDDTANLQRMYYHLFRYVLRARWPDDAVWRLHPDEHTAMDWETVQDCLENVATNVEVDASLFAKGPFKLRLHRDFRIDEIHQVQSDEHPLVQLADLFAGLAVFSRDKYHEFWQ